MLSIIIITKNEEKCLPRLLDSIKEQTFKDYEIIVSDANSIDRTKKIAKSFGCKIVDGGLPGIGRNNGAKVAKGDILLFLDADVVLPARFLELNLKEFKNKNSGYAVATYDIMSKNLIDKFMFFSYNCWMTAFQYFSPRAVGGACIFIKENLFNRINGFNENMYVNEDFDLIKRCGEHEQFGVLSAVNILLDKRMIEKEGRARLVFKSCYSGIYSTIFGAPKSLPYSYKLHGGVTIKSGGEVEIN